MIISEFDEWSKPEMFWKIRKNRDVKHWYFTMTIKEKLITKAFMWEPDFDNFKLLQCNIEDMALIKSKFKTQKFDVIIFSDVLEHLYDPVGIIKSYQSFLNQDGTIVVTVPNIANIFSRVALLFGYFNYSETGVMDKTHIRFFNRKNLKELAKESDLIIVSQKYDSIIMRWFVPLIKILIINNKGSGNILDSKLYQFYFKYLRPIEELSSTLLPSLFAFRLGMSLERK